MNRIGFLETSRAVFLAGGETMLPIVRRDWQRFSVVEVDPGLTESALDISQRHGLKSLDALHLASALILPAENLTFATWDNRLHQAARNESVRVFPPLI